jgi:hypothetical protein
LISTTPAVPIAEPVAHVALVSLSTGRSGGRWTPSSRGRRRRRRPGIVCERLGPRGIEIRLSAVAVMSFHLRHLWLCGAAFDAECFTVRAGNSIVPPGASTAASTREPVRRAAARRVPTSENLRAGPCTPRSIFMFVPPTMSNTGPRLRAAADRELPMVAVTRLESLWGMSLSGESCRSRAWGCRCR